MSNLVTKIKSSKVVNSGIIKKFKDFIYFKFISPKKEKKTDKYRKEIIEKFGKVCDKCKWQLLSGAFLRYYRDNTMDGQDLDFFVDDKDFNKIKNKFFDEGFLLKQCFIDNKGNITEYKLLYNDIEVDVLLMVKKNGIYSHKFTSEINNAKNIKKSVNGNVQIVTGKDYCSYERISKLFSESAEYEYEGINFQGPKDPEGMMYDLYGAGWRVYDPNFDCKCSPENNMPIATPNAKSIVYIKPVATFDDIKKHI